MTNHILVCFIHLDTYGEIMKIKAHMTELNEQHKQLDCLIVAATELKASVSQFFFI